MSESDPFDQVIELLVQQVPQRQAPPVETVEQTQERRRERLRHDLAELRAQLRRGFSAIHEDVPEFISHFSKEPPSAEEAEQMVKEGQTFQEYYGLSDELLDEAYTVAVEAYKQEDPQESIAVLSVLLGLNSMLPMLWTTAGLALMKLGQPDSAIEAYRAAIFYGDGKTYRPIFLMAAALAEGERYREAQDLMEKTAEQLREEGGDSDYLREAELKAELYRRKEEKK